MSYFVAERARSIPLPPRGAFGISCGGITVNHALFLKMVAPESWKPEQYLWDESGELFVMIAHLEFWLVRYQGTPKLVDIPAAQMVIRDALMLLEPDERRGNEIAIAVGNEIRRERKMGGLGLIARAIGKIRGDDKNKRWERAAELVICDIIRKHIPVHPGLMKGV